MDPSTRPTVTYVIVCSICRATVVEATAIGGAETGRIGRAVHIHFKVRVFSGDATTLEFTSQFFFDDTVTDTVLAGDAYDDRGNRDTRNASDSIFADGGSPLLLDLTQESGGGYVGRFTIGLQS